MLGLGADHVVVGDNVVLNPHYQTMGLYGSEFWTYVLPRRVGYVEAERLTQRCLPIGADEAAEIGLVDEVLPGPGGRVRGRRRGQRDPSRRRSGDYSRLLEDRCAARQADERRKPLEAYGVEELAEMSRDIFDDRNDFQQQAAAPSSPSRSRRRRPPASLRIAAVVETERTGEYAVQRAS